MDLVYIPEILTSGSFRSPSYHDYEQPWNQDYFNYKKPNYLQRQRSVPQQESTQLSKENCHLCRETKRRSLAVYIRNKSRQDSCQEIHEEEEENDMTHNEKNNASTDQNKSTKSNRATNEKS